MPKPFGSKPIALPARDALVLEWLGDGNTLDTNDGTKATLTATNVPYASCPVGYQKQWGVFNGSSSKVTSDYSTSNSSYSIVGSFRCAVSDTNNKTLFCKGVNGSGRAYWGLIGRNNHPTFPGKLAVIFASDVTLYSSTNFDDNKAHQFVLTATSGAVYLYVDNKLEAQSTSPFSVDNSTTPALRFGASTNDDSWFNGNLNCRLFNRIITEQERLAYWHEFNRQIAGGSDFGAYIPQQVFHCDWMGDSCDVANGKASTDTNVTQGSSDFQGLPRAALIGSSSNIKNGTGSLITSNNYTRYLVFKMPATWSGNPRIFDLENTAGNANAVIWAPWSATGKFAVSDYGGSSSFLYSSLGPVASTWYCIAHVQSGATAKIHVKPFGSARTTNSGNINGVTPGTDKITFSGYTSGGDYLPGALFWDAGIINSALSDSQIDLLFSECESGRKPYAFRRSLPPALGITAYYDGSFSGSSAYDVIGGIGTKTISGTMPASIRAMQNKAFAPTGSQRISLGDTNLRDDSGFWVGQWINTTTSAEMRNSFNHQTNNYFFILRYNSVAGKAGAYAYDGGNKVVNSTKTVNDGNWHFCITEILPGSYVRIWVDGIMEASTSLGSLTFIHGGTVNQNIFASRDNDTNVSGKADFMWGKGTLTPEKVKAIMYATYRF